MAAYLERSHEIVIINRGGLRVVLIRFVAFRSLSLLRVAPADPPLLDHSSVYHAYTMQRTQSKRHPSDAREKRNTRSGERMRTKETSDAVLTPELWAEVYPRFWA